MLCIIKNSCIGYSRIEELSSDVDSFDFVHKIFMRDFYIYDSDNCGEEELIFIFLKEDKSSILYKVTHEWWWEGDDVYKDRELINQHFISQIEEDDLNFSITEYINELLLDRLNK